MKRRIIGAEANKIPPNSYVTPKIISDDFALPADSKWQNIRTDADSTHRF